MSGTTIRWSGKGDSFEVENADGISRIAKTRETELVSPALALEHEKAMSRQATTRTVTVVSRKQR
jgi:hypothetical protein